MSNVSSKKRIIKFKVTQKIQDSILRFQLQSAFIAQINSE